MTHWIRTNSQVSTLKSKKNAAAKAKKEIAKKNPKGVAKSTDPTPSRSSRGRTPDAAPKLVQFPKGATPTITPATSSQATSAAPSTSKVTPGPFSKPFSAKTSSSLGLKKRNEKKNKEGETEKKDEDEDDDSEHSEDIVVVETAENAAILNQLSLAKLSRMGFRRHIWSSKSGSYFVILAFLGGYDVMNHFTFFVDKFGPSFCLMYCVTMLFIGFPLFYMEMALGQFTSSNVYNVFERMAPAMAGIGFVSLLLNFIVMVTDQMIVTYFLNLFVYTFNFFNSQMPWHTCVSNYNDDSCRELTHTCDELLRDYKDLHKDIADAVGLFYSSMGNICLRSRLQLTKMDDMEDWHLKDIHKVPFHKWFKGEAMGQHFFWNAKLTEKYMIYFTWPTNEFLLYMFVAWAAVYLICLTGKRFISGVAKFTTIFTVCVLLTFGILFLFISPAKYPYLHGTSKTLNGSFTTIFDMFGSATALMLYTLRLGHGGVVYLGSQYPFRNAPAKDCAIILLAASFIPLFYALCHLLSVDSYFLYLADGDLEKFTIGEKSAVNTTFYSSGHRIINFVIFMQSLRTLDRFEPFIICLLTAMGILITVINKVVRAEIIVSTIMEAFPVYADKVGRKMILHLCLAISFLVTFIFVSQDGLRYLIDLENVILPFVALCVVLAELLTVVCCYGGRRLIANIMAMNNRRNQERESKVAIIITKFITIGMWSFVIPIVLTAILIGRPFMEGSPAQFTTTNTVLAGGLVAIIPIFAIVRMLKQYRRSNNIGPVFRPDPDLWGPRTADDRIQAERLEKMLRTR